MSNNLFDLKKKLYPEWYTHGEVKVYTREEIDKWESEPHNELWAKIEAQRGLSKADIDFLDSLGEAQAETLMEDILEGNSAHNDGGTDG